MPKIVERKSGRSGAVGNCVYVGSDGANFVQLRDSKNCDVTHVLSFRDGHAITTMVAFIRANF